LFAKCLAQLELVPASESSSSDEIMTFGAAVAGTVNLLKDVLDDVQDKRTRATLSQVLVHLESGPTQAQDQNNPEPPHNSNDEDADLAHMAQNALKV